MVYFEVARREGSLCHFLFKAWVPQVHVCRWLCKCSDCGFRSRGEAPDTVDLDRLPEHFDDFMSIYSCFPAGIWIPVAFVGVVGFPVFIFLGVYMFCT